MEKFMLCTLMLFVTTGFVHVNGKILYLGSKCSQTRNTTGNYNTIYQTNLKTLLDSLAHNSPLQGGFMNTTIGTGSNQVYGLAWCRADVSPTTCSKCLNESIRVPLRDCPRKQRLGDMVESSSSGYGRHTLDEASVFSRGFSMMEALGRNVSDRALMFDIGVIDVGNDGKRYGLGQCSQDLSKFDCEKCLEKLLMIYKRFVLNRTGWEMLGVSCGLWYDDVKFSDNDSELTT
ncbi:unnamed protein product [Lactuca saligna]|uniref:Gnk2-homologous domain-containing protein n=1 Tax=Lactuca saligna TaxID=75948 RepID=A0AA35ZJ69_LACSI|nr:unnamed protein product [Lactuca saligna]